MAEPRCHTAPSTVRYGTVHCEIWRFSRLPRKPFCLTFSDLERHSLIVFIGAGSVTNGSKIYSIECSTENVYVFYKSLHYCYWGWWFRCGLCELSLDLLVPTQHRQHPTFIFFTFLPFDIFTFRRYSGDSYFGLRKW
jgi:hypothetical protein